MRADCGSYFVTTYIHTDTTWGIGKKLENRKKKERKHTKNKKKKKKKKKRKEKRRKKISVYVNAKALGLNCKKREK